MRNQVALIVSVLCMGVALFALFSTGRVAGTATGQTTETSVTTTASPTTSVETPSPAPTTTLLSTPSVARKEVSQPPVPSTPTTTQTPGYGDDSPLCDIKGNRVCGVPDESGVIFLVCHDTNGLPIRIVSDARNCK